MSDAEKQISFSLRIMVTDRSHYNFPRKYGRILERNQQKITRNTISDIRPVCNFD